MKIILKLVLVTILCSSGSLFAVVKDSDIAVKGLKEAQSEMQTACTDYKAKIDRLEIDTTIKEEWKKQFDSAQAAWVHYAEDQSKLTSYLWYGGSGAYAATTHAYADLIKKRISEINNLPINNK